MDFNLDCYLFVKSVTELSKAKKKIEKKEEKKYWILSISYDY